MGRLFTKEDGVFLGRWLRHPLSTASVLPSGASLAKLVAAQIDPARPEPVLEIGAGTGAITEALLTAGVSPDRLIVVERDDVLFRVLHERFPRVTLVHDDAVRIASIVRNIDVPSVSGVVSGLPILAWPESQQRAVLDAARQIICGRGPFVQFTYSPNCPISRRKLSEWGWEARPAGTAWLNLPPASVWVFSPIP